MGYINAASHNGHNTRDCGAPPPSNNDGGNNGNNGNNGSGSGSGSGGNSNGSVLPTSLSCVLFIHLHNIIYHPRNNGSGDDLLDALSYNGDNAEDRNADVAADSFNSSNDLPT